MADVVWSGPQPSIAARAAQGAVSATAPAAALAERVAAAVQKGRPVHFLAPYRGDHTVKLAALLGVAPSAVKEKRSAPLHQAVAAQRLYKTPEEVEDIELAVDVSREMYAAAMRAAAPGKQEHEIVAEIARVVMARGCTYAFPPICSVHGETLHNPFYRNTLEAGGWMVLDSGVETPSRYASDITRTIPVSGTFSSQQRAIYEAVLRAQTGAIAAVAPGVPYRDVHLGAAKSFVNDLTALGLMKGNADEAVAAGAHALFFPHGLGHMMGLDVHDMENLGEDIVGYGRRRAAELAVRPGLSPARAPPRGRLRHHRGARPLFHPGAHRLVESRGPARRVHQLRRGREVPGRPGLPHRGRCARHADGRTRAGAAYSEGHCGGGGSLRAVTGSRTRREGGFPGLPRAPGLLGVAFGENARILGSNLPH